MKYVRNLTTGKVQQIFPEFWEHNNKTDFEDATFEDFQNWESEHITFVCIASHGQDAYFEDPIQGECHTIERESKVHFESVHVSEAQKFYDNYLEQNADNPPYDRYDIKMAYWTKTREPVSLRQFQEGEM
jgi:hypothetical protein